MTDNDSLFHNRKSLWCFFPADIKYISYIAERLEALSQSFLLCKLEGTKNTFEGAIRIDSRSNIQEKKKE